MQVHTVFRNGEGSNRLRSHAEEAIQKLDRVHDREAVAHVTFSSEGVEQRVEARVHVRGQDFVCTEKDATYEAALDRCVASLRRSLLRHKEQARVHDAERQVWH